MKKYISLLLSLLLIFAMAGCGSDDSASSKTGNQSNSVNDVLEQGMAEEDGEDSENAENTESTSQEDNESSEIKDTATSEQDGGFDNIDVDLTTLSSTMVYSEVSNIMAYPEDYVGKVVKMAGQFADYHDEATDTYYFACIIQDATACCAQGIEFVLTDDYVYPDDYPEVDDEICVVGVFDTYEEGDFTYCTLRNAKLI